MGRPADRAEKADPHDVDNAARGHLVRGLSRGFGGAIVFALPVFMTMEMWYLGLSMDRSRLVLLLLFNIPVLVFISHYSGFERTFAWRDDLRDAMIACGMGLAASTLVLLLFGVIGPGRPVGEIIGKIAVQVVPASLGALLARSTFGDRSQRNDSETYFGEVSLMAAGALFLSFNTAPTDEIRIIAYKMTAWHACALVMVSIALMHAFVFAASFRGGTELSAETPWWSAFVRFTLVGYIVSVAISLYVLWTFGSLDDHSFGAGLMVVVVLAFPAAIGAAAARLIL